MNRSQTAGEWASSGRMTACRDHDFRLAAARLVRRLAPPLLALLALVPALLRGADSVDELMLAARKATLAGEHKQAAELLSKAIKRQPDTAEAYYRRGRTLFRLGQFKASVEDFDKYVKLAPRLESRQWERGIAQYYAGQFKRGAKQFELYQTYHDNDVENSVWRFLCMAPTTGVKKARSVMLPIRNDRRVPMMQIFEMFRGELEPEDVLKAVEQDKPSAEEREGRLFYARLYLGLYYEANKQHKLAKKYILLAADKHRDTKRINNYMWAVADVHAKRIRAEEKKKRGKSAAEAK